MSGEQGPGPEREGSTPARRTARGDAGRRLADTAGTPRLAALDGLLRDLDDLRRTVETDLTLAAAAVDAGETDLAAALVQGDRDGLAVFEQRALAHLRALDRADASPPLSLSPPVPLAGRVPGRRRARRLARLLPAAPLVAAAAALVGLLGIPQTATRPAPPQVQGAVLSSWEELNRLSAADAPADEVRRAARDLNADITDMLDAAGDDPAATRQALALLREAQVVLAADDDAPQLSGALLQVRQLAARLLASLPPSARPATGLPASARPAVVLPSPRGGASGRQGAGSKERRQPAPRADTAEPTRAPASRPPVAPRPSAGTASPTPTDTASPSSSPSGRPAPTPPPVLPGPVTDPL